MESPEPWDDDEPPDLPGPTPPPRRGSTIGTVIGAVLGVVLVAGGLFVVGTFIVLAVGLSHMGSNK
ncbi:MAG TPA: hypothetical protein VHF06_29515 [Pseudonocardiaceae bacterium]|jgi:hypothetical protein|nr:hypothetical protein [Pseudonocardiaceae bacterium]